MDKETKEAIKEIISILLYSKTMDESSIDTAIFDNVDVQRLEELRDRLDKKEG